MFENKVAIITGGSKGIGLSIASALAARTLVDLEKSQEEIISQGGEADIKVADISNIKILYSVKTCLNLVKV